MITKDDLRELVDAANQAVEQAEFQAGEADEAAAHGFGSPDALAARAAGYATACLADARYAKSYAEAASNWLNSGSDQLSGMVQAQYQRALAATHRAQRHAEKAEAAALLAYQLAQADQALIEADQRVLSTTEANDELPAYELPAWLVLQRAVRSMVALATNAVADIDAAADHDAAAAAQAAVTLVGDVTEQLGEHRWIPADF